MYQARTRVRIAPGEIVITYNEDGSITIPFESTGYDKETYEDIYPEIEDGDGLIVETKVIEYKTSEGSYEEKSITRVA